VTALLFAAVAALILAPLAHALLRPARAIGRGEADRALYEAQLAELETQRAQGRLDEAAHRAATVEVQRRLLAAPPAQPLAPPARSPMLIAAVVALVPLAGVALYLWRGMPDMPSAPYAVRAEATRQEDALLASCASAWPAPTPPPRSAARASSSWATPSATAATTPRPPPPGPACWKPASTSAPPATSPRSRSSAARWPAPSAGWPWASPASPTIRGCASSWASPTPAPAATTPRAPPGRRLLADAPANAPWREVVEARLRALP
jgi:cytochrome c-type biogenesis protein CcmH